MMNTDKTKMVAQEQTDNKLKNIENSENLMLAEEELNEVSGGVASQGSSQTPKISIRDKIYYG